MSEFDHPSKPLFDYLFSIPRYRDGQYLDINALDHLDPVHARRAKHPEREFDYDGDMGRGHEDYLRGNGIGHGRSGLGDWKLLGERLPVIEAPSIVPDDAVTQPAKIESEG